MISAQVPLEQRHRWLENWCKLYRKATERNAYAAIIRTVMGCSSICLGIVSSRKSLCNLFKERHDIVPCLGGRLQEHDVIVLFSSLFTFLGRHFAAMR